MHVVIDRLGASGRMMQIHPAKTINPKVLRALQVDTAAEYGIALNDTPRVSRGHRDRGLSSPEWRAEQRGERRDQSPRRKVYAKTASSYADDAIGREANELKKLSDRYRNANTPERRQEAKALERAAFILSSGGTLDDAPRKTEKEREIKQATGLEFEENATTTETRLTQVVRDSRTLSDVRDDNQDNLRNLQGQPRRLAEAELRDVLAAEERKLVGREMQAEKKLRENPERSTAEHDDDRRPDESSQDEANIDSAPLRAPEKHQRRRSEPNRPLSEKELSEAINQQVKEMHEAEKRGRDSTPSKSKDNGLDIGFD
jgi:hypothetical protein